MNTTFIHWKSLPDELLNIILPLAAKKQPQLEACNVALVCKGWFSAAQTAAYSNIEINSVSQLKKFHGVIKNSPHLGNKVKTLHFRFFTNTLPETVKVEESNLLTDLLMTSLPNLEVLKKMDLHTCVPNLHTLLDSQLKHLRRLQQPIDLADNSGFENYAKCALMMKDRLEDILISCGRYFLGEREQEKTNIEYQQLYDSLYQFNNLVDIKVAILASDGIQVLEHLVESCIYLKNIDVKLEIFNGQPNITQTISKYIPRSSVETLKVSMHGENNDHNLPWYIMHKFSQLQNLHLRFEGVDPVPDIHLITKFLEYVYTLNEFFVAGISTNQDNLMETIGNVWKKTATSGSESFHINYPYHCPVNVKSALQMKKKIGEGIETTLQYPLNSDFEWRSYIDFIKNSGKYIATMSFDLPMDDDRIDISTLPDKFFHDTLTACSNLKSLHFNGCVLRQSTAGFDNNFSIDELSFQRCLIEKNMLQQLSRSVNNINTLQLCSNKLYIPENEIRGERTIDQSQLMVNMPHSSINRIVFKGSSKTIYIKVLLPSDGKSFYHRSSAQDNLIHSTTEQEYEDENDEEHIYISCTTKPSLEAMRRRFYKTHRRTAI